MFQPHAQRTQAVRKVRFHCPAPARPSSERRTPWKSCRRDRQGSPAQVPGILSGTLRTRRAVPERVLLHKLDITPDADGMVYSTELWRTVCHGTTAMMGFSPVTDRGGKGGTWGRLKIRRNLILAGSHLAIGTPLKGRGTGM